MQEFLGRVTRLLGEDSVKRISEARIIIFGIGGVGSWCAEGLVRSGASNLTIVDSDLVSPSNINRQLMATTRTVGRVKVEAMRERLLEINPEANITAIQNAYNAETADSFRLEDYDCVVDCIDSLSNKIQLILHASSLKSRFYSSMGAALKIDPTRIRVAEFWNVRGCPLAAIIRKKMRQSGRLPGKKFPCVFSDEVLDNLGEDNPSPSASEYEDKWTAKKAQVNGSLAHITAIFGFTLSGLILEDITQ